MSMKENSSSQRAIVLENHPQDCRVKISEDNIVQTLSGKMGTGGGNVPLVMDMVNLNSKQGNKCMTLNDYNRTSGNNMPLILEMVKENELSMETDKKQESVYSIVNDPTPKVDNKGVAFSLRSRDYKDAPMVAAQASGVVTNPGSSRNQPDKEPILLESNQNHATIQTNGISTALPAAMGMGGGYIPMITDKEMMAVDCRNGSENNVNGTLQAKSTGGTGTNFNNVARVDMVVRRLTPLECERLQGFPDGWTDIGEWVDSKGKTHKDADSPRYKALGNSIALPFWKWMAKRMINILKGDGIEKPTMASLFDGIGGFPLSFSTHGAKAIWASEIEEFPIAVTKVRFPKDNEFVDVIPSDNKNDNRPLEDGMCVLEGNGQRPSHKGDGYKESNVSYTLNSTEQHAVCYQIESDNHDK